MVTASKTSKTGEENSTFHPWTRRTHLPSCEVLTSWDPQRPLRARSRMNLLLLWFVHVGMEWGMQVPSSSSISYPKSKVIC